ncbi:helix-hairpin-helix domain-containing protein [Hydrogenophaga sp. 5NK40-0174]|uniref:helix-hairpin-helix domain-containing protein n=1 Tax=Hydrogenophaga sp. 5NK40-0174 TaxID=3127649 RepID=UPI003107EB6A
MNSAFPLDLDLDNSLVLDGSCEFSVNADRVVVRVGAIRNLRGIENLSGSLAVELWALHHPLDRVEPEGQPGAKRVAATTIGEISGQHFVPDCRYDLLFEQPLPGAWQMSLLLREWNGHGYTTRSVVYFPVPFQVDVGLPETKATEADTKAKVEAKAKPGVPPTVPAAKASSPAESAELAESAAKTAGKKSKASVVPGAPVNLNTATVDEIASLKGVSPKLAKEIVATRPHKDIKRLVEVKGIGEKLLRAIRPLITLD